MGHPPPKASGPPPTMPPGVGYVGELGEYPMMRQAPEMIFFPPEAKIRRASRPLPVDPDPRLVSYSGGSLTRTVVRWRLLVPIVVALLAQAVVGWVLVSPQLGLGVFLAISCAAKMLTRTVKLDRFDVLAEANAEAYARGEIDFATMERRAGQIAQAQVEEMVSREGLRPSGLRLVQGGVVETRREEAGWR